MRNRIAVLALTAVLVTAARASEDRAWRADHTAVTYAGAEEAHAQAIGRIVEAARKIAAEQWVLDVPATIHVDVSCRPGNAVRLFTDGQDRVSLSVRSVGDLARPEKSGIFHVYGLCHEVGHLAMYRAIKQHDWLTTAGAEGWAHYLGSRLVDRVYEAEGQNAWCDPYDYRADGMKRLEAQLKQAKRAGPADGAALWKELVEILGQTQIGAVFKAWGEAKIDPTDPGAALREALLAVKKDERLAAWWNRAEPVIVFKRPRSGFAAKTIPAAELLNRPMELARDDGKPAGKMSIAGSGHGVGFEAPGEGWYLVAVRIFGSRYGMPQAPNEDFQVWLCDEEGKTVRQFAHPYRLFQRGEAVWVKLPAEPTEVPRKFSICVAFNPSASKGVFVHHDAAADGDSWTGLPGAQKQAFARGDWMIRAVVDQAKAADALRDAK